MVNDTAEKASAQVDAAEFAAKCLELLDEVARSGGEVVITRNGRPVSRLVACAAPPAAPEKKGAMEFGAYGAEKAGEKGKAEETEKKGSMFGVDRGRLRILGDVVSPMPVEWYADPDANGHEGEDGKGC